MKEDYADYLIKKTREDYDKIAGDFNRIRSYIWEDLARFAQYAPNGGRVLDFGCGNGRLTEIFKGKNIKYVGIDSSLKLPFADASFDAVYSIASFHHIPSVGKREGLLWTSHLETALAMI